LYTFLRQSDLALTARHRPAGMKPAHGHLQLPHCTLIVECNQGWLAACMSPQNVTNFFPYQNKSCCWRVCRRLSRCERTRS